MIQVRTIGGLHYGNEGPDIRSLVVNNPESAIPKMKEMIKDGKLGLNDFAGSKFKDMYKQLGDVKIPAFIGQKAINSSLFQFIVDENIKRTVEQAYTTFADVTADLVTEFETEDDPVKTASMWLEGGAGDIVKELEPYTEASISKEWSQIDINKYGKKVSITEETSKWAVIAYAEALGRWARRKIANITIDCITDRYASRTTSATYPYYYKPSGTGTALYSSTANTPGARVPSGNRVTNNPLSDVGAIETAIKRLLTYKTSTDANNTDKIDFFADMSNFVLLVPYNLYFTAAKILNSTLVPGVENEFNPLGPGTTMRPKLLPCIQLDGIHTTAWYLGNFKAQFQRAVYTAITTDTLGGDTQVALDRDIIYQARVKFRYGVGAVDYCFVVQNLADTTYLPN